MAMAYSATFVVIFHRATEKMTMARIMAHPKSTKARLASSICRGIPEQRTLENMRYARMWFSVVLKKTHNSNAQGGIRDSNWIVTVNTNYLP